ncbi:(Fe-S)-binding protein [Methanimicrococcus blatticola]|uniref:Fe-S oxidoreductase n=1 Tax=Methanimicrococcus blatticola TaxID=91560 RepID=A0A484F5U9_9EURY|nr:(Fe-S)-binding protein [Methanimicrococcus blatticola]MBZ3935754.1 (Fe-S)-binding protein [Methanimicrococcus blatticola]MCC2508126.1 (Fe-S)-binding protein [Methanimicrococcus blatticola]TDQ68795.1 Fe-S oxidoreductase [Methanimicrococcus blatticola]
MDLIQLYTDKCSMCGLCIDVCPSYDTVDMIPSLCDYIQSGGKEEEGRPLEFDIRLCYTCNVCTVACPEDLGIRKLISASREKKTKIRGASEEQGLVDPFSNNNIYKKIGEWENPVEFKNEGRKSDVVYFPGCAASCMNKVVGKSTVRALNAAGVDYSVMSGVDYCCGSVSAGAGNTVPLEKLGQRNIDEINARGSKILITTCPGCYRAFKLLYPQKFENLNFEVLQTSEYFARLLNEGKLNFKRDMDEYFKSSAGDDGSTVGSSTVGSGNSVGSDKNDNPDGKLRIFYQDPCHLTRALGIYEDPRRVLSAVPGAELVNPTPDGSICCGFGGGVRTSFPKKSVDQAADVHEYAKSLDSDIIITNCGGCMKNIIEGGYMSGKENGPENAGLPVYDLAEFISIACGNEPTERDDLKLIYLSNKSLKECLTHYDYEPFEELAADYDPDLK